MNNNNVYLYCTGLAVYNRVKISQYMEIHSDVICKEYVNCYDANHNASLYVSTCI